MARRDLERAGAVDDPVSPEPDHVRAGAGDDRLRLLRMPEHDGAQVHAERVVDDPHRLGGSRALRRDGDDAAGQPVADHPVIEEPVPGEQALGHDRPQAPRLQFLADRERYRGEARLKVVANKQRPAGARRLSLIRSPLSLVADLHAIPTHDELGREAVLPDDESVRRLGA